MGKIRYDWAQMCNEYTTASKAISKQELADKYGLNRTTLSLRATKEQWDLKRDRFLTRVQEQTTEKKAETVATEGARWDAACMETAKALLSAVNQTIVRSVKKGTDGKSEIILSDVVIVRLANATARAQEVGKAALGDKSDTTITVEGKVNLSIEQVIEEYRAAIGAVPKEDCT